MSLAKTLSALWPRRRPTPVSADAPIPVILGDTQAHPIDLRWVDELMGSMRPHLMVRPEDELLIVVPNSPHKMNGTALRILQAVVDDGASVREVLRREGDSPRKRRELHYFFSDLKDLVSGSLGEGRGRKAVVQEKFSAEFCDYPVISEVALTYKCNLSCTFCYAGCSRTGLPEGWTEDHTMSDDEVCRVLDRLWYEARCPSVSFTGGEPTLRPALPRFVAHAKALGMKVNIISNGQNFTRKLVAELAAAGLDSAQLSLEGPNAAVHDGLVHREGAFDRFWVGLERLREAGVRVHTNTTVSAENLDHLDGIVDLVADKGLTRLTMNFIIPCGTAKGERDALEISYTDIGAHVLRLKERAVSRGVEFIWYSPIPACIFNTVEHGLGNQGCAAADGLIHVNPAGDVLPCSSFDHDESLGNLLTEGFDAVWQSESACFFRNKEMMPPGCATCDNNQFCQGACTLYWREVGLEELGGSAADKPPTPEGFGHRRVQTATASDGTPRVHLRVLP